MKQKIMVLSKGIFLVFFSILSHNLFAQKTQIYTYEDKDFRKGIDLFNKEKYGAAQEAFKLVIGHYKTVTSLVKADAEYYYAVCAIELFNPDAEYLAKTFIEKYPESPRVQYAHFNFGKYFYRDNRFLEALKQFNEVQERTLKPVDKSEYLFKKGYCYYQAKENDKARDCFRQIKDDSTNKYKSPALYYYSHIEYQNKNYETAYKGFVALKSDETFAPVVPYYITQILFIQKKYQEVIDFATPLMDGASVNRVAEIARILAESYYQLGQYDRSLIYMEKYLQTAKNIVKTDNYMMGFLYYRVSRFGDAVKYFSQVTNENDSLSQNAFYHLADCYAKLNQKEKARNAFIAASKIDADKAIKQDAMFSYAKITYELGHSPFNEAIISFQQYIDAFPTASNIDEAYAYLVKVYMSTKDYKDALAWLDKIKKRDNEMNFAYQRIAFYRGLEIYNSLDYQGAIDMLSKSLQYSMFDKNLTALAYFWRGDAQYRLEKYGDAIDDYKTFTTSPGALGKAEYPLAHYYLGYCYFKQKKYDEASKWFRTFVEFKNVGKTKNYCDACNRTGDSYFMQKKYDVAMKFYDQAYATNSLDFDYALFQKSFCAGLIKKLDLKIDGMTKLLNDYPQSALVDDATFEIAETWCAKEQPQNAIPYYESILKKFPTSSYVKKSLLQLGLIYVNVDQNDKALTVYKQFINDYKGAPESKNALNGIKNIYISKNDASGYLDYYKSVNGENSVSEFAQDSLIYLAGEDAYMKDNCVKSNEIFGIYNKKFPKGIFSLNALYYRADCFLKIKQPDSAAVCYQSIVKRPKNKYTEASLFNLSQIQFNDKQYDKALESFILLDSIAEYKSNQMEARKGTLLCYVKLKDSTGIIKSAEKLLATEKVPEELIRLATFNLANVYLQKANLDKAMELFQKVAQEVKSAEGAESKFHISEILFRQGKIDESEKIILNFLDQNSPQQYWMAKSYILWADIFETRKDDFQAKHTLQSIIDNYPDKSDGILIECQQKLDKLNTPPAPEPVPVQLDNADEIQIK